MLGLLANTKRQIADDIEEGGDGRPADYLVPIVLGIVEELNNMLSYHGAAHQAVSLFLMGVFDFVREICP